MFLDVTVRRNRALVEYAFELHQSGLILPDTYVIDLDTVLENGRQMLAAAKPHQLMLFAMTKQFGRNPLVSRELMKLGFDGAVVVDYKEARVLHEAGIPIGHIGHLVQVPSRYVGEVVGMNPSFITVFSLEKAKEIDEVCRQRGTKQKILLRVIDHGDLIYPGQEGGIRLDDLAETASELMRLPGIEIAGLTSFPCFLYDEEQRNIVPTKNVATLHKAKALLASRLGLQIEHLNLPSSTSADSMAAIHALGGTQAEPGHGLLGTTPLHAQQDLVETPAMVYVTEVSHNLAGKGYAYGGGHYRRSHMAQALAGKELDVAVKVSVDTPDLSSIDYYLGLQQQLPVGDTVVMSFRTQVFVTRSDVAVVRGLASGNPQLAGIYDSQGRLIGTNGN